MRRPNRQLRVQALDVDVLTQVNGARGTACGNKLHCTNCGHSSMVSMWADCGNCCPCCGQGEDSSAGDGSAKVSYL